VDDYYHEDTSGVISLLQFDLYPLSRLNGWHCRLVRDESHHSFSVVVVDFGSI